MRNRIDRLRFRLQTGSREAERLQGRCSAVFHDGLRDEIARVIEACDASDEDERIELSRLVIDVGDIGLTTFEDDLQARVPIELERVLRQALGPRANAAGPDTDDDMSMKAIRWRDDTPQPRPGRVADVFSADLTGDTAEFWWDAVLRYLDTGVWLPPAGRAERASMDSLSRPDTCLSRLLALSASDSGDTRSAWRLNLAERILDARARRRLFALEHSANLRTVFDWLMAPIAFTPAPDPDWSRLMPLAALVALQRFPVADQARASRIATFGRVALPNGPREPIAPQWGRERSVSAQSVPPDVSPQNRPDAAQEACLDAVLRQPLSEPIRHMLRDWLMTRTGERDSTPRLATLTAGLHERLVTALDLREMRPTLHASHRASHARRPDAGHAEADDTHGQGTRRDQAERAGVPARSSKPPGTELEPWVVASAGLSLLWPMLPRLFQTFGLIDAESQWVPGAQSRAVAVLDWLAWGQTPVIDWRMPVPRVLCGLPLVPDEEESVDWPELDMPQTLFLDSWLGTTLATLPGLQRLSVTDLRTFFLQRTGALLDDRGDYTLTIEPDATDVLLYQLPWPLSQVMLPWLDQPLTLKWKI